MSGLDYSDVGLFPVVFVRNAEKSFDHGRHKVLDGFSMTVEKGIIYSLLGASGCGKTTALKCILGLNRLQNGDVLVCGRKPGIRGFEIPGNLVGYMPQDYALHGIFSIGETLKYYGTLFGMKTTDIDERICFLTDFLGIPNKNTRVDSLSGGQQRRVSLAVALIHSPELLILDEPTVGVDPLLREKIWQHLVLIAEEKLTTVIITTHYIEEARYSHIVGMMRKGKLIAEDSPCSLLKRYNVGLLEDIVIELCRRDERRISGNEETKTIAEGDLRFANYNNQLEIDNVCIGVGKDLGRTVMNRALQRLKALTMKNVFTMWRNIFLVLFMAMTPTVLIVIICSTLGKDPSKPLNIGFVNNELFQNQTMQDGCDLQNLSFNYLKEVHRNNIKVCLYKSENEALGDAKDGKIWGYVTIPELFSSYISDRFFKDANYVRTGLYESIITYHLDVTSSQISSYIKTSIEDSLTTFIETLLINCGRNQAVVSNPLKQTGQIYGKSDSDFAEFIAPSMLVTLILFFPFCSSSVQYIIDKRNGTLERARAAGVNTSEIMASYFFTEGVTVLFQVFCGLAVVLFGFGIENHGNLALTILNLSMVGAVGVSGGFLLATVCSQETEAALIACGCFFPMFAISGLLWPIESMSDWMQIFSLTLPPTMPAESLRSIMSRGWGISHYNVWAGLVSSFVWIFVFCGLTFIVHWKGLKNK